MSGEMRKIEIAITTRDHDQMPTDMYADDAVNDLCIELRATLLTWYTERGHLLLACEPDFLGSGETPCRFVGADGRFCILSEDHRGWHWPTEICSTCGKRDTEGHGCQ